MILSGSNILLLDPSGRFLPEDYKSNSYAVSLNQLKGCVLSLLSQKLYIDSEIV